ncbi:MAG: shikimate dehydrogenase [Candidatus Diapherotrites archaeon]|jgi:shikimate dehydrogenase|nr:shikimate dehydrogenase [Candidatus Diapherotrites archaeon]MBT4596356.1 shikimate dehydrogenase [Candidatus Diapherotrites archaeon]
MINAKTKVLAVIGKPIGHSMSPLIHNAALKKENLNVVYTAFEVNNVKTAIDAMKELDFIGYSVTIPHKIEVMQYMDEIDSLAKKIGAVNTVLNKNGRLIGYNSDCNGVINALKEKTILDGKVVYVLGNGGATRAIVTGLLDANAKVVVFGRDAKKVSEFATEFGIKGKVLDDIDTNYDILVNATPVGMSPNIDAMVVSEDILKEGKIVFDIVYNPLETLLLKKAKANGCITIAGVEMFLEQAYIQFELFTGKKCPKEVMREIVFEKLKERDE